MNRRIYSRGRAVTNVSYNERKQAVLPYLYKGYTVDGRKEQDLCPFFDECTVNKGFKGQLQCLINKKSYCRNEININRCEHDLLPD